MCHGVMVRPDIIIPCFNLQVRTEVDAWKNIEIYRLNDELDLKYIDPVRQLADTTMHAQIAINANTEANVVARYHGLVTEQKRRDTQLVQITEEMAKRAQEAKTKADNAAKAMATSRESIVMATREAADLTNDPTCSSNPTCIAQRDDLMQFVEDKQTWMKEQELVDQKIASDAKMQAERDANTKANVQREAENAKAQVMCSSDLLSMLLK